MKKWIIITLIALPLVVLGVALYAGWNFLGAAQTGDNLQTAPVERGNLAATISATGTIEPVEVVDVGAQIAGIIRAFGVDPKDSSKVIDFGSQVDKGTELARIDDAMYLADVEGDKADVGQAEANVKKAAADLEQMRAKLVQAERDWKRVEQLIKSKSISDLDYDTAQNAYESAKAAVPGGEAALELARKAVDKAKATLEKSQTNLSYTVIKSPVKGVIIDRRVNIGQTVVSSLNAPSLFLIAKDLKKLQVWASVNEADIGQIHPGQPVHFTVDAFPGQAFDGEVGQIRLNATMTQNVVTYTVVVNTDNSSGKLLPYMTANLQFQVEEHKNVLRVPNAALRWKPQPQEVAPDARDGMAEKRQGANAAGGEKGSAGPEKEHREHGMLWVKDGKYVRPVKVQVGLSDGIVTEVNAKDLQEGTQVVIREAAPQAAGSDTTNPFIPKLFSGRKQQ